MIQGGMTVCDLDVPKAFQRCEHHEQVGRAIAFILIVMPRGVSWLREIGTRVSAISCFEVSSRQTTGKSGSCGRVYTSSASSMAATKAALASGGIASCSWR